MSYYAHEFDMPSVEERDQDYILPEHDEEWNDYWFDTTRSASEHARWVRFQELLASAHGLIDSMLGRNKAA
jgi:hypothetical protein